LNSARVLLLSQLGSKISLYDVRDYEFTMENRASSSCIYMVAADTEKSQSHIIIYIYIYIYSHYVWNTHIIIFYYTIILYLCIACYAQSPKFYISQSAQWFLYRLCATHLCKVKKSSSYDVHEFLLSPLLPTHAPNILWLLYFTGAPSDTSVR